MDLYQLRTFVAVAREGSITRAAEVVELSQPAVSAHVRDMEDALGLALFERTSRGMALTPDGRRLLGKAEQTLAAHRELMEEAARGRGKLTGKLRLGAGSHSSHQAIGHLLAAMAERFPQVEVTLRQARSAEILAGLRSGALDAGVYNEGGEVGPDLSTIEVARFAVHLAAARGAFDVTRPIDWAVLAGSAWIYAPAAACCGRVAERFFEAHRIRPARVIGVDTQAIIRTLVATRLGLGLLHADAAEEALRAGEVELLCQAPSPVRVLFAQLGTRRGDPVLSAAASILREWVRDPPSPPPSASSQV